MQFTIGCVFAITSVMEALAIFGRRPLVILLTALAATVMSTNTMAGTVELAASIRVHAQGKAKKNIRQPMVFYLATGSADACGPGCSKWIAAEGRIDRGASQRLRRFLREPSNRKLPIYFLSRGGDIKESIAIGRLVRKYRLKAGVARTMPNDCDAAVTADQSFCDKLKRSGKPLTARFRTSGAYCNSACVYAFVGAPVREVGTNARLGVHVYRVYLHRPPKDRRLASRALARADESLRNNILAYLREVGISSELFRIASRVRQESMHVLTLEEIDRLKIVEVPKSKLAQFSASINIKNTSGAGESAAAPTPVAILPEWKLQVSRASPAAISIDIAGANATTQFASLRIICEGAGMTRVSLRRERDPDENGIARPIALSSRSGRFVFPPSDREAPVRNGRRLDERLAHVPTKFFESPGADFELTEVSVDDPSKDLREKPRPESQATAVIKKIPTEGLATSLAALQQRCREFPPFGIENTDISGLPE